MDTSVQVFAAKVLPRGTRVLELGIEHGVFGGICRALSAPSSLVGVDLWEPYLEEARSTGYYDELVKHDLQDLPLPFASSQFGAAVCLEVLEHLPKTSGAMLVEELKRLSPLVVVTTPNGFRGQEALDGNPLQRHVSAWSTEELRRLGFRVRGFGNLNFGRHQINRPVDVSHLLSPLSRILPRLSTTLFGLWRAAVVS